MIIEPIRWKEVEPLLLQDDCLIVDLRVRSKYEQGHIPNACCIPYNQMNRQIDRMRQYKNIILYCERGNISLLAARDLVRAGVSHAYSLYGGYDEYKRTRQNVKV